MTEAELEERVARAIGRVDHAQNGGWDSDPGEWDVGALGWHGFMDMARAAIQAMREAEKC